MKFKLALIIFLQSAIGLLITILTVRFFGLSHNLDAFFNMQAIFLILVSIFMVAIQNIILPQLSVLKNNNWSEKYQSSYRDIAILTILFVLILSFATLFLWTQFFPNLILQDKIFYVWIFLNGAISYYQITNFFLSIAAKSQNKFILSELLNCFGVVLFIIFILVSKDMLTLELLLSINFIRLWVVNKLYQKCLFKIRHNFNYPWIQNKKDIHLMRPIFFSSGIYKFSPLVDRYWVTQGGEGVVSLFTLVQSILSAASLVFEKVFNIPDYPSLADHFYKNKQNSYLWDTVLKKLGINFMLILCSYLVFFLLSDLILSLMINVLSIEKSYQHQLSMMIMCLIGFVYASSSGNIITQAYGILGNTRIPSLINVYGFLLSIVFKSWAYIYFGLNGLLLAISLYYMGNLLTMLYFLKKKIWYFTHQ